MGCGDSLLGPGTEPLTTPISLAHCHNDNQPHHSIRALQSTTLRGEFIMVAAMNRCPCGYQLGIPKNRFST